MSTNNWTRLAGALGGSAVLLGAMGAHAMIKKPETYRTIWNTGNTISQFFLIILKFLFFYFFSN